MKITPMLDKIYIWEQHYINIFWQLLHPYAARWLLASQTSQHSSDRTTPTYHRCCKTHNISGVHAMNHLQQSMNDDWNQTPPSTSTVMHQLWTHNYNLQQWTYHPLLTFHHTALQETSCTTNDAYFLMMPTQPVRQGESLGIHLSWVSSMPDPPWLAPVHLTFHNWPNSTIVLQLSMVLQATPPQSLSLDM